MRRTIGCALVLLGLVAWGCGGGGGGGATAVGVVAEEEWEGSIDGGQGSSQTLAFEERADGTILASGTWSNSWEGYDVTCPFSAGVATLSGDALSFTATGTAHTPDAPPGYRDSSFVLEVEGTLSGGEGSGTYVIRFSTEGWPATVSGTWSAHKVSGSGITEPGEGPAPSSWESVGAQVEGAEAAVVRVDESGVPYVAYKDRTSDRRLAVERFDAPLWVPLAAGATISGGGSGGQLDFEVTGAAQYAVYQVPTEYEFSSDGPLYVMRNGTGGWEDISGDFEGHYDTYWGSWTRGAARYSVALDAGQPLIAFLIAADGRTIVVQKYDGTHWVGFPGNGELGWASWLTPIYVESIGGTPYLAYTATDWHGDSKASVRANDGTAWVSVGPSSFPTQSGQQAWVAGFTVDGGVPYVALEVDDAKVQVFKLEAGSWVEVGGALPVALNCLGPKNTLIVRDAMPYFAYIHPTTRKPMVKKSQGTGWVDAGGPIVAQVGACTSLSAAMAPDGTLYVAFTDDDAHENKRTVLKASVAP